MWIKDAIGTSVWTGRALQAGNDDLEIIGLALLYPALAWSVRAPGHHGYPRASVLIRVYRAQRVHRSFLTIPPLSLPSLPNRGVDLHDEGDADDGSDGRDIVDEIEAEIFIKRRIDRIARRDCQALAYRQNYCQLHA
jgi:hypothetical protein